jgi:hypothetical protein
MVGSSAAGGGKEGAPGEEAGLMGGRLEAAGMVPGQKR